ncbi:hypothetical protein CVT26_005780 [Gymnopilus dilepis]|uniref:Uncharacterized protein n=1 Tax=Gymnopilus dilepis TaxID=231916 RepID=A0A409VPJ1_9AGAR|nr:hypothetical protein CVT26_005780 [Gymnopilus dilepis]
MRHILGTGSAATWLLDLQRQPDRLAMSRMRSPSTPQGSISSSECPSYVQVVAHVATYSLSDEDGAEDRRAAMFREPSYSISSDRHHMLHWTLSSSRLLFLHMASAAGGDGSELAPFPPDTQPRVTSLTAILSTPLGAISLEANNQGVHCHDPYHGPMVLCRISTVDAGSMTDSEVNSKNAQNAL